MSTLNFHISNFQYKHHFPYFLNFLRILYSFLNFPFFYTFFSLKGATKFYFMHYSCEIIILFKTGLGNSASSTFSFGKLVFCLFVFSVFSACSVFLFYLCKLYKIYIIIVFIVVNYSVILHPKKHATRKVLNFKHSINKRKCKIM